MLLIRRDHDRNRPSLFQLPDEYRRTIELVDQRIERFAEAYQDVKNEEMQQYRKVISSWEREFLLLNV